MPLPRSTGGSASQEERSICSHKCQARRVHYAQQGAHYAPCVHNYQSPEDNYTSPEGNSQPLVVRYASQGDHGRTIRTNYQSPEDNYASPEGSYAPLVVCYVPPGAYHPATRTHYQPPEDNNAPRVIDYQRYVMQHEEQCIGYRRYAVCGPITCPSAFTTPGSPIAFPTSKCSPDSSGYARAGLVRRQA